MHGNPHNVYRGNPRPTSNEASQSRKGRPSGPSAASNSLLTPSGHTQPVQDAAASAGGQDVDMDGLRRAPSGKFSTQNGSDSSAMVPTCPHFVALTHSYHWTDVRSRFTESKFQVSVAPTRLYLTHRCTHLLLLQFS